VTRSNRRRIWLATLRRRLPLGKRNALLHCMCKLLLGRCRCKEWVLHNSRAIGVSQASNPRNTSLCQPTYLQQLSSGGAFTWVWSQYCCQEVSEMQRPPTPAMSKQTTTWSVRPKDPTQQQQQQQYDYEQHTFLVRQVSVRHEWRYRKTPSTGADASTAACHRPFR
jgi:hypothetical protein